MSIVTTSPPAGENWGGPPDLCPIPFTDFAAELLELYKPPQRAKATYKKMESALRVLAALIGDGTTAALTPALIARIVTQRPEKESPNTTHCLLRNVQAACNYAVSRGYLRSSPFGFRRQWVRRTAPKPRKHHSADEMSRVLELARSDIARKHAGSWSQWRARRLYALVATVAYTGLRKMEAIRLRVEDIDLAGRMLLVVERHGSRLKTEGSAQPVPIPDALAVILAEWLPYLAIPEGMKGDAAADVLGPMPEANPTGKRDPGWVFPNAYRTGPWVGGPPGYKPLDRLRRLGDRAGVKELTFLSLRHTWATHAESRWGFSEAMIQRVLRHTSRRTQYHYRHADPDNLRAAVQSLGFGHEPTGAAPEPPALPAPAASSSPTAPVAAAGDAAPPKPKGKYHGVKLSDEDVAEAKELRARGWTYAALIARYGVAKSTLHYALYGATHRHVPPAAGPSGEPAAP